LILVMAITAPVLTWPAEEKPVERAGIGPSLTADAGSAVKEGRARR
jgi:hypothetical protein